MPFMSPTGRHVTAAEALQLGIVDKVTDRNTVETAVKFALSITGETHERRCRAKSRFSRLKKKTHKERKIESLQGGYFWAGPTSRSVGVQVV